MSSSLVKSFAKKSGKPKVEVEKAYKSIKESLKEKGKSESDPDFYAMLVGSLKKTLEIKEEKILLDKFKKYLRN